MLEDDNSEFLQELCKLHAAIALFFEWAHGQLLHTSFGASGLLS